LKLTVSTAPITLSNGPTLIEAQSDFVASAIEKLEAEGAKHIEATSEAADAWDELIEATNAPTLFPLTNSWEEDPKCRTSWGT